MAYTGGKGNCFRRIIGVMPQHVTYIETHLGGGAVMLNKRPARRQIGVDADQAVISRWRDGGRAPCELVCADAVDFLKSYPFDGSELVYSDPPYPRVRQTSRRIYRYDYAEIDHEHLLDTLLGLPCAVMVSGTDTPTYARRLAGWRRIEFTAGARKGIREEVVWANFDTRAPLHDPRYRGEGFRDRERLKRKFSTLTRRIENLPPTELAVFAEWFSERYANELAATGGGGG